MVRGNRDLMIDRGFCRLTGCKLLGDENVIHIDGQATLIMHGDLLCTRDVSYQLFRKFMETATVRSIYSSLTYRLRIFLSRRIQPLIKKSAAGKLPEIIDVEQATVEAFMTRHNTNELIHGHTHKPDIHHFELNGRQARRVVLGDWYEEDSVLVCRDGERKLLRVGEYLNTSPSL